MSDFDEQVVSRLCRVVSRARAEATLSDVLEELGLQTIETPRELHAVSEALMARAGMSMISVVARSLKAKAILLGGERE